MAVGRVSALKLAGLVVVLGAVALLCAPAVSAESAAPVSNRDHDKLELELARIGKKFDPYGLTREERGRYVGMRDERHKVRRQIQLGSTTGVLGLLGSLLSGGSLYDLRRRSPSVKYKKLRYGVLSAALVVSLGLLLNGLVHSVKAANSASDANRHRHELLVRLLRRYQGDTEVDEEDLVRDPYTSTVEEDTLGPD